MKVLIKGAGLLLACCFFCCGCSEKVLVDGRYCNALDEKEMAQMIEFARLTLLNSPDQFSPAHKKVIAGTLPKYKISYSGDKKGRLIFEWLLDSNTMVRLNCEGKFLTESMIVNSKYMRLSEAVRPDGKSTARNLTFEDAPFDVAQ